MKTIVPILSTAPMLASGLSLAFWAPVSPTPVVVNNQNAVTNPIAGTQQFYRLTSP